MSAMLREATAPQRRLLPMAAVRLDEVMAIENLAYDFPWTRGNFIDGLAAGYEAQLLLAGEQLVGYFVAMVGVEEMHLLNLTVAPGQQGRGHARFMLAELVGLCRRQAAEQLWLEVRGSNRRAHAVYSRFGFAQIGIRKGYYPAPRGQREDAIVMSLQPGGTDHALD